MTNLAEGRDKCQAVMNTVMDVWFTQDVALLD